MGVKHFLSQIQYLMTIFWCIFDRLNNLVNRISPSQLVSRIYALLYMSLHISTLFLCLMRGQGIPITRAIPWGESRFRTQSTQSVCVCDFVQKTAWLLSLLSMFNLLKPTGYVMHHQFNIQQLYALPTLYLCVLYLSENKQRLVPLTA